MSELFFDLSRNLECEAQPPVWRPRLGLMVEENFSGFSLKGNVRRIWEKNVNQRNSKPGRSCSRIFTLQWLSKDRDSRLKTKEAREEQKYWSRGSECALSRVGYGNSISWNTGFRHGLGMTPKTRLQVDSSSHEGVSVHPNTFVTSIVISRHCSSLNVSHNQHLFWIFPEYFILPTAAQERKYDVGI